MLPYFIYNYVIIAAGFGLLKFLMQAQNAQVEQNISGVTLD